MGEFMSKQLAGIQGVLGNYVTSNSADASSPASKPSPRSKAVGSDDRRSATSQPKRTARLGRPPGKSSQSARPKEKATLRIDAEMMSDYRDWSWEKRCQLGELVERALADYRRRNR